MRNNQTESDVWQVINDLIEQKDDTFFKKTKNGYRPSASKFAQLNVIKKDVTIVKYGGKAYVLHMQGNTYAWTPVSRNEEISRIRNPIIRFFTQIFNR